MLFCMFFIISINLSVDKINSMDIKSLLESMFGQPCQSRKMDKLKAEMEKSFIKAGQLKQVEKVKDNTNASVLWIICIATP